MAIEVEGLEEFIQRLTGASDTLNQEIAEALRAAGDAFVDSAQAEAPVKTGFLRDHITVISSTDTEVVIESGADYSAFQEFGTYKMDAQPYFFQAADDAEREMEQQLSDIQL